MAQLEVLGMGLPGMIDLDDDPDWQVGEVGWDAIQMTAAKAARSAPASKSGGKRGIALRTANTSCQVEGCAQQLLPLRSYYQRQHICEEHFRALSITDASGRVTRFCQQCTKLEPLCNFDGERRSCRASLERRNTRRHGKRASGNSKPRKAAPKSKAAAAKEVAAAAAAAVVPTPAAGVATNSGSGSGSTTAVVPRLGSPSHPLTDSSSDGRLGEFGHEYEAPLPLMPGGGGWGQNGDIRNGLNGSLPLATITAFAPGQPTKLARSQAAATAADARRSAAAGWQPPQSQGSTQLSAGPVAGYWLASSAQRQQVHHMSAAAMHAAGMPNGAPAPQPAMPRSAGASSLADVHLLPLGEVGGLSPRDVEDLLAIDTDKLAEAILGGGIMPQAPASPPGGSANASGTTSAGDAASPNISSSNAWYLPAGMGGHNSASHSQGVAPSGGNHNGNGAVASMAAVPKNGGFWGGGGSGHSLGSNGTSAGAAESQMPRAWLRPFAQEGSISAAAHSDGVAHASLGDHLHHTPAFAAQPGWALQQDLVDQQLRQQQAQAAQMQQAQAQPRAWHQALLAGGHVPAVVPQAPSASASPYGNSYAPAPTAAEQWGGAQQRQYAAAPQQGMHGMQAAQQAQQAAFQAGREVDLFEDEINDLLADLAPAYEEVRLSLKLYGVRPEHLPPDMRCELLSALQLPPTRLEASLRAGCVQLTVDALASPEEGRRLCEPGAAAVVAARLAPLLARLPEAARVVVQVGGTSAALLARQAADLPTLLLSLPMAGGAPGAAGVLPPAVELAPGSSYAGTVTAAGGRFRLRVPRALLSGSGRLSLHCRVGGRHVAVSLSLADGGEVPQPPEEGEEEASLGSASLREEGSDTEGEEEDWSEQPSPTSGTSLARSSPGAEAGSPSALVEVEAWVPAAAAGAGSPGGWEQAGWGLYVFEVSSGALLSEAVPVLLLPDSQAAAAAELSRMRPSSHSAGLLRVAAAALRYLVNRGHAAGAGPAATAAFRAAYPPLAVSRIASGARLLLDVAERAAWPSLTQLLLPAAVADGWHPAAPAGWAPQPGGAAAEEAALPPSPPSSGELERRPSGSSSQFGGYDSPDLSALKASYRSQSPMLPEGKLGGTSAAGHGKASGLPESALGLDLLPELGEGDSLRRVMHPAVLGGVTLLVTGLVVGMGVALVTGHLG